MGARIRIFGLLLACGLLAMSLCTSRIGQAELAQHRVPTSKSDQIEAMLERAPSGASQFEMPEWIAENIRRGVRPDGREILNIVLPDQRRIIVIENLWSRMHSPAYPFRPDGSRMDAFDHREPALLERIAENIQRGVRPDGRELYLVDLPDGRRLIYVEGLGHVMLPPQPASGFFPRHQPGPNVPPPSLPGDINYWTTAHWRAFLAWDCRRHSMPHGCCPENNFGGNESPICTYNDCLCAAMWLNGEFGLGLTCPDPWGDEGPPDENDVLDCVSDNDSFCDGGYGTDSWDALCDQLYCLCLTPW